MFDLKDLDVQSPLAGALGGVVRSLSLRLSLWEMLSSIVVGGICATYLGPIAEPLIAGSPLGAILVSEVGKERFSGFVIGLGGMAAAGFVMDLWTALRKRQKDDRNGNNQRPPPPVA